MFFINKVLWWSGYLILWVSFRIYLYLNWFDNKVILNYGFYYR